jgi:hypothetical protein
MEPLAGLISPIQSRQAQRSMLKSGLLSLIIGPLAAREAALGFSGGENGQTNRRLLV